MKKTLYWSLAIISLIVTTLGYSVTIFYGFQSRNIVGMSAMGNGYVFIGLYIVTTVAGGLTGTIPYLYSDNKRIESLAGLSLLIISITIIFIVGLIVIGPLL